MLALEATFNVTGPGRRAPDRGRGVLPGLPDHRARAAGGPHVDRHPVGGLRLGLREVHPPRRGLGDGRAWSRWSRDDDVRVAFTNMGSTPLRATAVEEALKGGSRGRRRDRRRVREGRRRHRAARRPERHAGVQGAPGPGAHEARADHRRRGHDASRARRTCAGPSRSRATSPTARWPRRCTWPARWSSRCCWRARPGWARPRWPGRWPRRTGARLFRLQCHEGIDLHHALYDWDYPRQLLAIRAAEGGTDPGRGCSRRDYLLRRPLLRGAGARRAGGPADRRGRPRRRRVRGLPARAAVGLRGVDPRARHGDRRGGGRWWC